LTVSSQVPPAPAGRGRCGSSCPSLCEMRNSSPGQKHILGRGFCLAVHDALRLNTARYLVTPPARRSLAGTAPSRAVAGNGRRVAVASCPPTAHLKLILSFILHHARHAGHSFVRTHLTKARKTREATGSIVDILPGARGLTQDQWHKIKNRRQRLVLCRLMIDLMRGVIRLTLPPTSPLVRDSRLSSSAYAWPSAIWMASRFPSPK
jgi:hypothetical protein